MDCPKWFYTTSTSLQLDSDGHPHLANGGNYLYYAWHDGSEWHYETVNGSGDGGSNASLALDRDSRPHISYCGSGGALKYAWRTPHFALTKQATPADGLRNGDKLT